MSDLTYEQKEILYQEGYYLFKAPPVSANYWSEKDWINFVDTYGGWLDHKFIKDGGSFDD